jgi:putative phosphoesterase
MNGKREILIVSDLHGSKSAADFVVKLEKERDFAKIFLLGDLGYSGARNVPPADYYPIDVMADLNLIKEKAIFIRGNCDSRVDEYVLKTKFHDKLSFSLLSHSWHLTHGDIYSPSSFMLKKGDIYVQGHTHIPLLKEEDGVYYINPGTLALPKSDLGKTYIIFDKTNEEFVLYSKCGNILGSLKIR